MSTAAIDDVTVKLVTSPEELTHALAVRAICFMEGDTKLTASQTIDENDYLSTHVIVYSKREPIGSARIRWFCDFAKIERTAFRPDYRDPRILKKSAEFIFNHIAQKGYRRAITHAEPKFSRVWERLLGFKRAAGRPAVLTDGHEPYLELIKQLSPPIDAITLETDPVVLFRIEGRWHIPSEFETMSGETNFRGKKNLEFGDVVD
jgi:hypothetical protein